MFKNLVITSFLGIACFSGSIYLIQLTKITAKSIWFITPLGVFLLVLAWFLMLIFFSNKTRINKKRKISSL